MNMFAAVDANWAIGNKNDLLVRIPSDQKYFREETTGKVIVLGRKTLATFPQGVPLPNRENIILSKKPDFKIKNALVVHSIEDLLEELKQYPSDEIYIIGGETVYRQMLPYCDVCHITKMNKAFEADTYFPNLDEMPEWVVTKESEEQTYFDLEYVFKKYERKSGLEKF